MFVICFSHLTFCTEIKITKHFSVDFHALQCAIKFPSSFVKQLSSMWFAQVMFLWISMVNNLLWFTPGFGVFY